MSPTKRSQRSLGDHIEPMYASVGDQVPAGRSWTFEPKYDGVRVLAHVTPKAAALITRNGHDKHRQFPEIVTALTELATLVKRPFVMDGEIVALIRNAPARFQALQGRMHRKGTVDEIREEAAEAPAAFIAFDLLVDGDVILAREPWTTRRAALQSLVRAARGKRHIERTIRLSPSTRGNGAAMLQRAHRDGWEGVIAKEIHSTYEPGVRTRAWQKLKIEFRQELVVGGFTEPRNTRPHLGALLLGYFDDNGKLIYAGHTGGGFTQAGLRVMRQRLDRLVRKTSPFATKIRTNQPATWVKPEIVVEVKFSEWTGDGRLRQPVFLGTRDDKDAREVTREAVSVQG
jgi:bifunctional non-homologous end joining protein LigD